MKVHKIYKKVGQTPLEALEKFRKSKKISMLAKLTYAGRLDPMAEGVLLILQGASQKERERYLSLPKVYEAEVLFGFKTDSYDVLGLAKKFKDISIARTQAEQVIKSYKGKIQLPIPPYSSVIYKGKPLFEWARAGQITAKALPLREMKIKSIQLKGTRKISSAQLLKYIQFKVKKVKGDFRQNKILKTWQKLLLSNIYQYQIIAIIISCSSGTYIRSISNDLGKRLDTGAVLINLKRLSVGNYKKN